MHITEKWKSLLEKMQQLWDNEMTPEEPQETAEENTPAATEPETVEEPANEEPPQEEQQGAADEQEIENARLAAQASQTKPKEDPSIHEFQRSANEQAYNEDVKLFQ